MAFPLSTLLQPKNPGGDLAFLVLRLQRSGYSLSKAKNVLWDKESCKQELSNLKELHSKIGFRDWKDSLPSDLSREEKTLCEEALSRVDDLYGTPFSSILARYPYLRWFLHARRNRAFANLLLALIELADAALAEATLAEATQSSETTPAYLRVHLRPSLQEKIEMHVWDPFVAVKCMGSFKGNVHKIEEDSAYGYWRIDLNNPEIIRCFKSGMPRLQELARDSEPEMKIIVRLPRGNTKQDAIGGKSSCVVVVKVPYV